MHEEVTRNNELSPETLKGTSIAIGLFVDDPHAVMAKAVAAGGTEIDPVQDYDYDYRQGCLATLSAIIGLLKRRSGNKFPLKPINSIFMRSKKTRTCKN